MFGIEVSVEIAILPMLGGAGTLLGPLIGSLVLETASEIFKNIFHEAHLLIYGILIVLVVLFLPEGIVGTLMRKLRIFKAAPPTPFAGTPPPGPAEESKRVPLPQMQSE
jgi:branched-chain amino acid transport system permease protein